MRGSLRRWMVAPLVGLTLVVTVAFLLLGSHLIHVLSTDLNSRILRSSSQLIANSVGTHAHSLASEMSRPGKLDALGQAMEQDDSRSAISALAVAGWPSGVTVLAVADASGRWQTDLNAEIAQAGMPGPNAKLTSDPAVNDAVQRLLVANDQAPVELGLAAGWDEPMLYAAGPARTGDQRRGVLVAGMPLEAALKDENGAFEAPLVVYDAGGKPIYSTSVEGLGVTGHLADLLANAPISQAELEQVKESSVLGRTYLHVARSLTVDGVLLGFLSTWQPPPVDLPDLRRWQILMWAVALVGGALAVVLGLRLSTGVTRPILALAGVARGMAGGDLSQPAAEDSVGELREVATSLNYLAQQLEGQSTKMQAQVRQSNYLFQASAEMGRTLNLDESLQTAAEALYGLGGLSYVVILAGRGELGPYTCRAARGLAAEDLGRIVGRDYQIPLWGVMARSLVSRQLLVIDDTVVQGRPPAGEFDWDVGRSMFLFPVCGENEPTGLIIAGSPRVGQSGVDGFGDMAFALSRIAAHSILNAQLYQEATRFQEQLVTLQVISKVVASATDSEVLLGVVVREAGELMGGSAAWLYLHDPAEESKLYKWPTTLRSELWTTVHQDAVSWVLRASQPIFYDPQQPLSRSPILANSGPAVCVPLEAGDEPVGALVVVGRHGRVFFEDDMIVLRTVANGATAAYRVTRFSR